jgi:hypothetical protein
MFIKEIEKNSKKNYIKQFQTKKNIREEAS